MDKEDSVFGLKHVRSPATEVAYLILVLATLIFLSILLYSLWQGPVNLVEQNAFILAIETTVVLFLLLTTIRKLHNL